MQLSVRNTLRYVICFLVLSISNKVPVHFRMDDILDPSRVCPLIIQDSYECDSVDLSDQKSKDYWLRCILDMLTSFRTQARLSGSQAGDSTAEQRATDFYETTKERIEQLSHEDYPKFSIRRLLDLIQTCLKSHGFDDPWRDKKRLENDRALLEFRARLDEVDGIVDLDDKWTELVMGVLAGE